MSRFITRVELFDTNDGTSEEYTKLHIAMGEEGFERTITSDDNVTYYLPPAEYFFEGDLTRSQVLELAKTAAKKSGKQFSVLVTQSSGITWQNLKPVKK